MTKKAKCPALGYRPIIQPELARDLRRAAGLAGMSVPAYLHRVVHTLVQADLRARATELASD